MDVAAIIKYLQTVNWSAISNIAELIVAILGFVFLLREQLLAKGAANSARDAADRTRNALIRSHTLTDIGTVIAILDEIKRHHRHKNWDSALERYATARSILVSIRNASPALSPIHQANLQNAQHHLGDFEDVVERWTLHGREEPDPAELNSILSDQIESLDGIKAHLQQEITR